MRLVIGNKRYSSWSLRPWLVMTHFGLSFEEHLIPLDEPTTHAAILKLSPSGRVPCLIDGDLAIWETLAIIEYLAETHPDLPIWPRDRAARAMARAISNEMHAGFAGLRSACPMNLRRSFAWRDRGQRASEDANRIVELWREARSRHALQGPFLFGEFSAADAMYAPVVHRFNGYSWPVEADTRSYMDAMLALPAMQAWSAGAAAETWIVAADEVPE